MDGGGNERRMKWTEYGMVGRVNGWWREWTEEGMDWGGNGLRMEWTE